jgi:ribonuclease Z
MLSAHRDNTALALSMDGGPVLIDVPGSVPLKLLRAGIDPLSLSAVVITHTHPDHIYGLPSLVHNLWMANRSTPLPLFAPATDLERLQRLLDVFDLARRATFLDLRPLSDDAAHPFFEQAGHRLYAHPVDHGPPAYALRWDTARGSRVLYSGDTRPLDALAAFGRGAALFVHEATYGEVDTARAHEFGHTTPAGAGRLATLAEAGRLVLVHLTYHAVPEQWVAEAKTTFAGPIEVPDDGAVYAID